jgi:hypothetical protein
MVCVVSLAKGCWEEDFILKELLPPSTVLYYDDPQKVEIPSEDYVLLFSVVGANIHHLEELCLKKKPIIIFMISDESGVNAIFNELSKYTTLFIRQYHHSHYQHYPNIVYMPLGYMRNMLPCKSIELKVKSINERQFVWSFIGELRQNREKMIKKFRSSDMIPYFLMNGISASDMFNIYSNSIFVPNGRGRSSLDCLRLYEASLSGAIPVVVGKMEEIGQTFMQEGCPPWIYAASWDSAIKVCKKLLNNPIELQKRQNTVLYWWNTRVVNLRTHILTTLNEKSLTNLT